MGKHKSGRIVLTGASGKLGRILRPALRPLCETLVLSDRQPLTSPCTGNEIFVPCDLADHAAVGRLLEGAERVIHMGGCANERPFEQILHSNLIGQFNLYDQALNKGIPRVVLASSNHVTGFYLVETPVSPEMPMRPDSLYAASKGYGELLARFYFDRHGIESVCLRIGSCCERPNTLRALDSWLSHADLCELVRCATCTPDIGYAVVYGVSDNPGRWWHSPDAERLGYIPRDNSERFRAELKAVAYPSPQIQGGLAAVRDYRIPESIGLISRPEAPADDPLTHSTTHQGEGIRLTCAKRPDAK